MVFSWDRKPVKRKYISVQNKSIRVKYERISPTSSGEQDPVAVDETSGSLPKAISASGSIAVNSEHVDKQSEEALFLSDQVEIPNAIQDSLEDEGNQTAFVPSLDHNGVPNVMQESLEDKGKQKAFVPNPVEAELLVDLTDSEDTNSVL